jgi:hypothetical protein
VIPSAVASSIQEQFREGLIAVERINGQCDGRAIAAKQGEIDTVGHRRGAQRQTLSARDSQGDHRFSPVQIASDGAAATGLCARCWRSGLVGDRLAVSAAEFGVLLVTVLTEDRRDSGKLARSILYADRIEVPKLFSKITGFSQNLCYNT